MVGMMLEQKAVPERRQVEDQAQLFDKLRELTLGGYLPQSASGLDGKGILLRHQSAPDLILQPDGSIDLPIGQPAKPVPSKSGGQSRLSGFRSPMIIIIAAGLWCLSVAITASIMEGL